MNADQSGALDARIKQLQSADPRKAFDDSMAELYRTQERLLSVRAELKKRPTKVTSKDGMVAVTLDERGEVTALTFNTAKFRRMAPAELGAALVEVIGRARAEGRSRVTSAYQQFLPEGMDLAKVMSGKLDVEGMLTAAKRRGEQILAEAQRPVPAARQPTRKG
jgi:DNA-binding protein YbaB